MLRVQRTKRHLRGLGENFLAKAAQVNQTHARDDLMRAALQLFEHLLRLRATGRFAKQLRARVNECVRAKHEGIRNLFRNRARLAIGVELTKLARGQFFTVHLRHIARHNAKLQSHLTQ